MWLGRGGGGGQGAGKGLRVFRTLVSDCTGELNETAVGRCFQTVEGLFRCGERPLERPDFRISMTTVKSYQHIFPFTTCRVLVEYRLTGRREYARRLVVDGIIAEAGKCVDHVIDNCGDEARQAGSEGRRE